MNKELEVAKAIALKAGETMRQYFDGDQQTEIKTDGSPVTIADKLINSMVIKELGQAFPDDGVIGEEESNTEYDMGRKWFCDPIDGTKAYTWGTPTAVFSLGLIVDGIPQMGVVYDPFLDRMYWALKGGGSYCDGQTLQVSDDTLKDGIVAVMSDIAEIKTTNYVSTMIEKGIRLATFSGAIYKSSLVAKGKFVGYIEASVNAHDMAAIQLIIEEAGGRVTNMHGDPLDYSKPFKGTIVSNSIVHDELLQIVNGNV